MPRSLPPSLAAFLFSKLPCWKADLFTVTLATGSVYRWTDFDQPVTIGGNTWSNQGPLLQRTSLGVRNTAEVPELQIKLLALDTDFVEGGNIKTQLHNGVFDGAIIDMERTFMPTPGDTSLGKFLMFEGRMSVAKIYAWGADITAKGANVLFNQYAPRNQFQPSCLHVFCDANCTLLKSSFTLTGQVCGGGTTASTLVWSGSPGDADGYTFGVVTMTSGAADGQVRTVKLAGSGFIQFIYPLYNTPAPGDTFSILRGCDKTFNSGTSQDCTHYANTQHWRGFDTIPQAEQAI